MKFKRNETRLLNGRERRSQNLKRQAAQLAQSNVLERPTLLLIGPFVDERGESAAAEVDRIWPMCRKGQTKAIEQHIPASAGFDSPRPCALAETGRWRSGKLAWAPVIAIAGLEVICVERPGQWS